MTDVVLAGVGVWSERYTDWEQFCAVLRGEPVEPRPKLVPELIAAKERRRAPPFVKMAVEVMDQACTMAGADPASVATVFASGMSDMQITDYMCRTLATMPATVSPTKFHNSVHNASTGYWSIATGSHGASNAISGYDHSAAVALLEGAVQAVDEARPVLVTVQEMAAPAAFHSVYDSDQAFAAGLLLAPAGAWSRAVAKLSVGVDASAGKNATAVPPALSFDGNFASEILPLLAAAAAAETMDITMKLSDSAAITIKVKPNDA